MRTSRYVGSVALAFTSMFFAPPIRRVRQITWNFS